MGGLTNTKYEQTQCAQHSSWSALPQTCWARLRGMCMWPTRLVLHETIHLPMGFKFPTVSFYWAFSYSSLPALKGKPKAHSWSWCCLFFIFLPGRVPSAPLQGMWAALWVVGYVRTHYSSHSRFLSLVSTSFPSLTSVCFPNWLNTWSKAFPHLQGPCCPSQPNFPGSGHLPKQRSGLPGVRMKLQLTCHKGWFGGTNLPFPLNLPWAGGCLLQWGKCFFAF